MSVWQWIGQAAGSGFSAVSAVLEWVGSFLPTIGDPWTRRQVAFSVALIALSAKMAKADGVVTHQEVAAFRGMFAVPPEERGNVDRLFDLARQDVAGYDSYARRVAAFYADDRDGLEDVMDGLFCIAKADGAVHPKELLYLESVSAIFGMDEQVFDRILARHVIGGEGDPYLVLGVERGQTLPQIRARYRKLVAENHPDRIIARGLPAEFVAIANDRMAGINRAWEMIQREMAPVPVA